MRHRHEAEDLITESRRAIDVLTSLVVRLENYTDRVENELGRFAEKSTDGGNGAGPTDH